LAEHIAVAARELTRLAPDQCAAHSEDATGCSCSLKILDRLPTPYTEILRRVDVEETSLSDVAALLGITVNNATVRLHRARKALRRQLSESCGTTSLRSCLHCGC
jgi:RNA polymerase sigma-70 factor (ECF subfamily)